MRQRSRVSGTGWSRPIPLAHASLERELIGAGSLLYTWPGSDPSLSPLVLMGHLDVVPVDPGTEGEWTHPPFEGVVSDGFVWGRGALDDKVSVVTIMEAVEALLGEGFVPARTVHLAFGHDEEVGGLNGARLVAEALDARGMGRAALVVDEGGILSQGFMPGVEEPVALVGVAEKGFLSLDALGALRGRPLLDAAAGDRDLDPGPGDHPPGGAALPQSTRRCRPGGCSTRWAPTWPSRPGSVWPTCGCSSPSSAPASSPPRRPRPWCARRPRPTIIQAGIKENVLPITARATVNFRILPGETRETVTAHVREIVSDPRIEIAQATPFATDPSPVSDPEGPGFRLVAAAARQATAGPGSLGRLPVPRGRGDRLPLLRGAGGLGPAFHAGSDPPRRPVSRPRDRRACEHHRSGHRRALLPRADPGQRRTLRPRQLWGSSR